jgi:hypothetical protein
VVVLEREASRANNLEEVHQDYVSKENLEQWLTF